MTSRQHEFRLNTDYYQFYLEDPEAPEVEADTGSRDFWSEWALKNKLAVQPGIIGVGISSTLDDDVDVTVELADAPPPVDFENWDQVVEASLNVSSGRIAIMGCPDYPPEEVNTRVSPGTYRVRVYYGNIAEEGADYYKLALWPQEYTEPKVLKTYEEPGN